MDLGLAGQVAVVTGASRGLGRSIALKLADEGMDLAIVARSTDLLETLQAEIAAKGRRVFIHGADLRVPSAPAAAIDAVVAHFGQLNLLVNNAGATKRGDFLELTDEDWTDGFALKLFGYVRMIRASWPHLKKSHGSIVNIGGTGGKTGDQEFAIGGTVNAGVAILTKVLADRGVTDGVRINTIAPGTIETYRYEVKLDRFAAKLGLPRDEAHKAMLAHFGVARFGDPDEVATLVAMMASPTIAFLQGAVVDLDGGETRTL